MSRLSTGILTFFALIGVWAGGKMVLDTFQPPSIAQSQERLPRSPDRRPPPRRLFQDLQLSRQQRQDIRAIHQQYSPQTRERAQSLRQTRQDLRAMIAGETSDTEIRDQFQKLEQLTQETLKLRFESMMAIRNVLTPDQRQRLAQKLEERRRRRQQQRRP